MIVPALTAVALLTAIGLAIWQWEPGDRGLILAGALRRRRRSTLGDVDALLRGGARRGRALAALAGRPSEAGHGEYHALLLGSILGMVVLAGPQNLVTLFVGFELLSIPLYVLCATHLRRAHSLEVGPQVPGRRLGRLGDAALRAGAALRRHRLDRLRRRSRAALDGDRRASDDPLLLTGIALCATGLAFKASVAPFHQWTPDVYEGAPTPITAFMAVATKAAAFAVFLRLFDVALGLAQLDWAPALAVLAAITIVVGNVGAIGQDSLKRMLGVLGRRPGRLHARPASWSAHELGVAGARSSTSRSTC